MSRTHRTEMKTEVKWEPKAKMRTCEVCEELYPAHEMYPIHSVTGYKIGVVCETCSADMELIDGPSGSESGAL